jgi:hypothetical protein
LENAPISGIPNPAGHGTGGPALDGAKGLIEFPPYRVLVQQRGNSFCCVGELGERAFMADARV